LLGKNYIKSDTLHDTTEKFYSSWNRNRDNQIKTLEDFPFELELGSEQNIRPNRAEIENPTKGFCIRTGEKIEFNLKKPFTYQAYRSWASFGNENYPENFCHKTGKPSNGKTSMRKPIL
jgi:hypothetical protein